ncbi:MAG TPA: DUF5667 domain-containing protein [Ktedonobacterales bacterium]|nr:DUF5667 domain-containing protein [Ktedonobacterales bacterium]
MTDTERALDNLLNDVITGRRTPDECLALCRQDYPSLVPSLRLALALDGVMSDSYEVEAARARARHNLDTVMEETADAAPGLRAPTFPHTRNVRIRQHRQLQLALCAAILALTFVGYWILSAAAATALPESPLYGIKQIGEATRLQLAWSNQQRGNALAQIAAHRLEEAQAEATQNHTHQALALMAECDNATHQLIVLAITMRQQHQDDTSVVNALRTTIQAEYTALGRAHSKGQPALAQALTTNITGQQHALSASNVVIPQLAIPSPTDPSGRLTPTPHNNNNGKGNGNNNGNGNGNNNGNGGKKNSTPTPLP